MSLFERWLESSGKTMTQILADLNASCGTRVWGVLYYLQCPDWVDWCGGSPSITVLYAERKGKGLEA